MKDLVLRAEVADREQLRQALSEDAFQFIYAPMELLGADTPDKFRIIAVPPVFLGDCEKKTAEGLKKLADCGITRVLAHTAGHILLGRDAGMKVHGGFRLNVANSRAQEFFEAQELEDTTLSIELTCKQLGEIKHRIPVGVIGYGNLPLMITRRCPINDGKPCGGEKNCGRTITDRKGNAFRTLCSNTVELLNPDTLVLSDRLADFAGMDFFTLKFTHETDISAVAQMYEGSGKPDGKLTRGLYYRGVE